MLHDQHSQVHIAGFNGSRSSSTAVGVNEDRKKERVPNMPRDLVLLCGHHYASDGAAILHKHGGKILQLTDEQLRELLSNIDQYQTKQTLEEVNRTYEIDQDLDLSDLDMNDEPRKSACSAHDPPSSQEEVLNKTQHVAFSNTATKYFNTKVNVSNTTDRILTLLLSGFTFDDWQSHVKNKSLGGIPPDVTEKALNSFGHRYGKTSDIIRLASPHRIENRTGLMDANQNINAVGSRMEVDVMEPDYNELPHNGHSSQQNSLPASVLQKWRSSLLMAEVLQQQLRWIVSPDISWHTISPNSETHQSFSRKWLTITRYHHRTGRTLQPLTRRRSCRTSYPLH